MPLAPKAKFRVNLIHINEPGSSLGHLTVST